MSDALVSKTLVICNPQGLHARPAQLFASLAGQFESTLVIVRDAQRVDAKSILNLLTLGAHQGTELYLEARGVDAQEAIDALAGLVSGGFAGEGTTLSQEQAS